ncbi:DUF4148 domain-containing protein [Burkholderia ubonensis]|uniref:DUF4148 domain-containing protein n=1 Tax=Burkholderia ubonensis TaxID=101571 RepID=UPI0009B3B322|nr:DUF4148 domain-containing protein [Burkholderia ubonensis]
MTKLHEKRTKERAKSQEKMPIPVQARSLTREEVKAELAELHALGYRSTGEDPHYPQCLQEAMAKLHENRVKERADAGEKIVPARNAIGDRKAEAPSTYQDKCVGPASF